jgi:hypothetical protein
MKPFISKVGRWFARHWRALLYLVIIAGIAVFALGLRLNNLVPGQTQYETDTLASLDSFPKPWQKVTNIPYLMPAYLIGKLLNNPLLGARITSVIFCLLATVCIFFIIKFWLKTRLAMVGSLLFITSSWLLNISHQATPLSWMVLAPLLLILTLTWSLKTKKHKILAFYSFAISMALAAYCPYAFWIIATALVVLIVKGRHKLSEFKTRHVFMAAAIYFILLFFLFFGLTNHPGQIRDLLGIPAQLPSIGQYFSNLAGTLSMLFIRGNTLPESHIGNLPFLDAFSGAMFLLGIYYFVRRLPKRSSLIFLISFVTLLIILPVNPQYMLASAILLPLVYLAVISGIAELLGHWFIFFPRNPMIRNLGVALVTIVIGLSCYYHLSNYYIAWPNSAATKTTYVLQSKE